MINKIFLVKEKDLYDQKRLIGASDDEEYIDKVIEALSSVTDKYIYEKTCIPFIESKYTYEVINTWKIGK